MDCTRPRKREFADLEPFALPLHNPSANSALLASPTPCQPRKLRRLDLERHPSGDSAGSCLLSVLSSVDLAGLPSADPFATGTQPDGEFLSNRKYSLQAEGHRLLPARTPLHQAPNSRIKRERDTTDSEPVLSLAPPLLPFPSPTFSTPAQPRVPYLPRATCGDEACTGCDLRVSGGSFYQGLQPDLRVAGGSFHQGLQPDARAEVNARVAQRLEAMVLLLANRLSTTKSQLTTAVHLALHLSQKLDRCAAVMAQRRDADSTMDAEESEGSVEVLPGGADTPDEDSAAGEAGNHLDDVYETSPEHVCGACEADVSTGVVLPCRHLALCHNCGPSAHTCPKCRGHVQSVLLLAD